MMTGAIGSIYLHHLIESIVENEGVCQSQTVRLHGVALPIMEISHIRIIKIGDCLL